MGVRKFLSFLKNSPPPDTDSKLWATHIHPKSNSEQDRDVAVFYLKQWLLTPYSWGEDDFHSIDCSGLIMEVLKGVGHFNEKDDLTADGIYEHYISHLRGEEELPHKGCLVFFFDQYGKAVHVGMMIDSRFMIHATGGGRKTKTIPDAISQNAFVKMRELKREAEQREKERSQKYIVIDPFKEPK